MKITPNEVDKLARLSRLSFTDAERTRMVADMEKILGFVAQINSLDLEGVEPLVYMMDEENVLRDDAAVPSLPQAEALRNAPDANSDYFRVPTVLKK
jgi:aspartyl-tRNA(Asn)/glutamyl-tRNA(Gln) amidotransferase subunit C